MAKLIITEYEELAKDATGRSVLAGREPAITVQSVTITTETDSSALNGKTRFVRLHAEAACHIAFGLAPTAAQDGTKLAADQTDYFGIHYGDPGSWIISVIQD